MDFLRSGYRQNIRYLEGDPSAQEQVTWYRAAPTALPFPEAHVFGSPTWDIEHPTPTNIGFNAESPRTYYNGKSLNSSTGRKFAGDLAWFQKGAPEAGSIPRTLNGTPLQCLDMPLGIALSGQSIDVAGSYGRVLLSGGSIVPSNPCGECPLATPATITVHGSGFTFAPFNADLVLTQQVDPCMWQVNLSGGAFFRVTKFVGTWFAFADDGMGNSAIWQLTVSGCTGSFAIPLVFSPFGGPNPLPITAV